MSRAAQGLRAWLLQRFSAVYLALYVVIMPVLMLTRDVSGYAAWRGWFGQPGTGVASALFALALLLHAWVGMRDVLIDYVHRVWLRLSLLSLIALLLLGSLMLVLRALLLAAVASGS